jgi:hypothetical protein
MDALAGEGRANDGSGSTTKRVWPLVGAPTWLAVGPTKGAATGALDAVAADGDPGAVGADDALASVLADDAVGAVRATGAKAELADGGETGGKGPWALNVTCDSSEELPIDREQSFAGKREPMTSDRK